MLSKAPWFLSHCIAERQTTNQECPEKFKIRHFFLLISVREGLKKNWWNFPLNKKQKMSYAT